MQLWAVSHLAPYQPDYDSVFYAIFCVYTNHKKEPIKHYLSFFLPNNFRSTKLKSYFEHWKIVGLAISGDITDDYNHRISNFLIVNDRIEEQKGVTDVLSETDYLNLFDNIDEERIVGEVSASSKKINKWLRSVDSQKRPILLSALMICLFDMKDKANDFKDYYNGWSADTIVTNIPTTLQKILTSEDIPTDKIDLIKAELAFLAHDQDLNTSDILKDILNELKDFIIPLFKRNSNYDIIGKFYEEFLRYIKAFICTLRYFQERTFICFDTLQ